MTNQSAIAYKECPACGKPALLQSPQCSHCGHYYRTQFTEPLKQTQIIHMDGNVDALPIAPAPVALPPPRPSYQYAYAQVAPQKDKVVAGLLALFLGGLGIHGFYLGNTGLGLAILLINLFVALPLSFVSFGVPSIILGIFIFIQAIVFFASSREEFHQKFVVEQRWL